MRWEELTVPDFARAVETSGGVVVVPIGVLEPHASHLPLGQDMLTAHWTASEAAKEEPVIVFPPYPWGINHDAAHLPGAIVLKRDLVLALLDALCDELGRNGFTKILLLNGHGGNTDMLKLFVKTVVEKKPNYLVYYANIPHWPDYEQVATGPEQGHACEMETSTALHTFPHLVKMEALPPEPHPRLQRQQELMDAGAMSFYDWYGNYPTMYVGDAHPATAEKGRFVMEGHVADTVRLIRAIKAATISGELQEEFFRGWEQPRSAY